MASSFVCEDPSVDLSCRTCGDGFRYTPKRSGRYPKECDDACRAAQARNACREFGRRYRADGRYRERERRNYEARVYRRTCIVCQASFTTKWNGAVCCSPTCVKARKSEAAKAQHSGRPAKPKSTCARCGVQFLPARAGSKQRAAGYVQKCCSVECANALRAPKPRPKPGCATCGGDLPAGSRKWCSEECRPPPAIKPYVSIAAPESECRVCAVMFPRRGKYRPKMTCGDECQVAFNKAHASAGNARSRAKKAGQPIQVEPIIDTRVFSAAQWRCAICRAYTPPGLRGTFAPDAPEIDHIKPLSAGGNHTYANVQCLCRLCNVAKGDHPFPHIKFWRRRGIAAPA